MVFSLEKAISVGTTTEPLGEKALLFAIHILVYLVPIFVISSLLGIFFPPDTVGILIIIGSGVLMIIYAILEVRNQMKHHPDDLLINAGSFIIPIVSGVMWLMAFSNILLITLELPVILIESIGFLLLFYVYAMSYGDRMVSFTNRLMVAIITSISGAILIEIGATMATQAQIISVVGIILIIGVGLLYLSCSGQDNSYVD